MSVNRKSTLKTKKSKPADLVPLSDILVWPTEREIMARPDRFSYVRKLVRPVGCVFCLAIKEGVGFEQLVLFKSEHCVIMMNKYPYNNGHLLVLPQTHTGELSELSLQTYQEQMLLVRFAVEALQEVYGCEGVNVGLNLGAAAGAGIPEHLHFHVIPRWRGDTNFFPLIAQTKVVIEDHAMTFKRLSERLTTETWSKYLVRLKSNPHKLD